MTVWIVVEWDSGQSGYENVSVHSDEISANNAMAGYRQKDANNHRLRHHYVVEEWDVE